MWGVETMYGKPGPRDDWANYLAKKDSEEKQARNGVVVLAIAFIAGGVFMYQLVGSFPL